MSTEILRRALEFVDGPSEGKPCGKGTKRRKRQSRDQTPRDPILKRESKKRKSPKSGTQNEEKTSEVIERLLQLSAPSADREVTEKILERVRTGKPVVDKIPIKTEPTKSILFSDEESVHSEGEDDSKYTCYCNTRPTVDFGWVRFVGARLRRVFDGRYTLPSGQTIDVPAVTMKTGTLHDGWIVIGISGVTNGGKTTLANKLAQLLKPVVVLNQDAYFYPDDSPHHIKCPGLDHNNYDIISSVDMSRMFDDAMAVLEERSPAKELAANGKLHCPGKKFLILEGFTVLNYKPLFDICHLRYYLILDYEECHRRRQTRQYDPPDIPGYFEQIVWPEHLKARAALEDAPGLVILDGTQDLLPIVMADLHTLGVREDDS